RSAAESRELLRLWLDDWAEHGIGYWAVRPTEAEEIIGFGGLRVAASAEGPVLNMYYRFRPGSWGHGYATEMAAAAVSWAEVERPGEPIEIKTASDNDPSLRLADKLGFVVVRTVPADGYTDVRLRR
ncbi:GNAT family N-acetyltransferase, partial [Nocardia gipuzkoensis]